MEPLDRKEHTERRAGKFPSDDQDGLIKTKA